MAILVSGNCVLIGASPLCYAGYYCGIVFNEARFCNQRKVKWCRRLSRQPLTAHQLTKDRLGEAVFCFFISHSSSPFLLPHISSQRRRLWDYLISELRSNPLFQKVPPKEMGGLLEEVQKHLYLIYLAQIVWHHNTREDC